MPSPPEWPSAVVVKHRQLSVTPELLPFFIKPICTPTNYVHLLNAMYMYVLVHVHTCTYTATTYPGSICKHNACIYMYMYMYLKHYYGGIQTFSYMYIRVHIHTCTYMYIQPHSQIFKKINLLEYHIYTLQCYILWDVFIPLYSHNTASVSK